ncbi:MAG: hypothetical protein ACFFDT_29965 [Candidatus Hodarchaeota archaeon]
MKKEIIVITSVSIIVVLLISGFGYWQINKLQQTLIIKQKTIDSLKGTLVDKEKTIDLLNQTLVVMNNTIAENENIIKTHENTIKILETKLTDIQSFEYFLLFGIQRFGDGLVNTGYASSQYDEFSSSFDHELFILAQIYADNAAFYYGHTQGNYKLAEGYFKQAQKYSSDKIQQELIDSYIKICEYGIKMYDEMIQTCRYYSSACGYYDGNDWSLGNNMLELGNEHLKSFNNLLEKHNTYLTKIDTLLEDFILSRNNFILGVLSERGD